MAILIVGGDRIDRLEAAMSARGLGPVVHWSGRKRGELHRTMPRTTSLVVVVWQQVSHPMLRKAREEAARRGIPVIYAKGTVAAYADAAATSELAARWLESSPAA